MLAGSTHGNDEFVSVAQIIASEYFDQNRVHIVYGLSEDLSLPGLQVGVLHSYNEKVHKLYVLSL